MKLNKLALKTSLLILCILLTVFSAEAKKKKRTKNKRVRTEVSIANKTKMLESKIGVGAMSTDSTLTPLCAEAATWLQTPYRSGGTSSLGMDCSGLTGTIMRNVFGIKLQRSSKDIAVVDVKDLKKSELKPGDLVFFSTRRSKNKRVNHVGVFLGNNHFIHASCSNGVIISNLNEPYYLRSWVKGGRAKNLIQKVETKKQPKA